jgi:hypothetical protein
MIEAAEENRRADHAAVKESRRHYLAALEHARTANPDGRYYPALNVLAADVVLHLGEKGAPHELDATLVADTLKCLEHKAKEDPDFWSVVGQTELRLYQALARRDLASRRAALEKDYNDLRTRVGAPRMWASVYDTARFVLPRYGAHAADGESEAAAGLLEHLRSLASEHDAAGG